MKGYSNHLALSTKILDRSFQPLRALPRPTIKLHKETQDLFKDIVLFIKHQCFLILQKLDILLHSSWICCPVEIFRIAVPFLSLFRSWDSTLWLLLFGKRGSIEFFKMSGPNYEIEAYCTKRIIYLKGVMLFGRIHSLLNFCLPSNLKFPFLLYLD